MATVVELTDDELAELMAFTRQADAQSAIRSAMVEYLRLARRLRLKELSGTTIMDDNWQPLEADESRDYDGDTGTGAH